MADSAPRVIAPGVTRYDRTHSYRLEGTKGDLIAGGFAQASWFVADGEHDKYGRIARSKKMQIDGRRVETRVPAKGLAYIDMYYTDAEVEAERERRRAAEDRASQRDMEELEQMELDEIPDSPRAVS